MKRSLLLLLLALPLLHAAQPDDSQERYQRIKAEVEHRREERKAREVVQQHEAGTKKASDAELEAARAQLRAADERRRKLRPPPATEGAVEVHLTGADIETVAEVWRAYFGPATVSDAAKRKRAFMDFPRLPLDQVREKMIAALRMAGIEVVPQADGVLFRTETEPMFGK